MHDKHEDQHGEAMEAWHAMADREARHSYRERAEGMEYALMEFQAALVSRVGRNVAIAN